jgi:hypothetical protein
LSITVYGVYQGELNIRGIFVTPTKSEDDILSEVDDHGLKVSLVSKLPR